MNITTEAVHQLQSPPPTPPGCSRSPLPSSIVILRPDSSSQQRWFLERRAASETIGNWQQQRRLHLRHDPGSGSVKKGAFTGVATAGMDPEEFTVIITTGAIKPRPPPGMGNT